MYQAQHGPAYDLAVWLAEHGPDIAGGITDPTNLPLLAGGATLSVAGGGAGLKVASVGLQGAQRLFAGPGYVSLGFRRRDGLDRFLNPLVLLSAKDRSMGMQLVGPTGSGKTSFALPIAVQDLMRGHNVLVIEIFGDLGLSILPYAKALGVPTFVSDPSDPSSLGWNPMAGGNREVVAVRIAAVMESLTDNPYYQESNYAVAYHLTSLAWDFAAQRGVDPDLELLDALMHDRDFAIDVMRATKTSKRTETYLEKTYLAWNERDRDERTGGMKNHLARLLSNAKAARHLCPAAEDPILHLREALSFPGACTIIRFPAAVLRGAARTGAALAFRAAQEITYERADEPRAGQRPLSAMFDEMHTLLGHGTKSSVEYTRDWITLVRHCGVMVLGAFQGYDLLPQALAGTVETNLRNLAVAGGLGPADLRRVRDALGTEEAYVEDERRVHGPNGTIRSRGRRLVEQHHFAAHELQNLKRGRWAVRLLKNGNVQKPYVVKAPKMAPPERVSRSFAARRSRARRRTPRR